MQWSTLRGNCTQLNRGLLTCFHDFVDDPATSNVMLKAGSVSVGAHKIGLAAQSVWFRGMFQVSKHMVVAGISHCDVFFLDSILSSL